MPPCCQRRKATRHSTRLVKRCVSACYARPACCPHCNSIAISSANLWHMEARCHGVIVSLVGVALAHAGTRARVPTAPHGHAANDPEATSCVHRFARDLPPQQLVWSNCGHDRLNLRVEPAWTRVTSLNCISTAVRNYSRLGGRPSPLAAKPIALCMFKLQAGHVATLEAIC